MAEPTPEARIQQLEIEKERLLDQIDVLKGALVNQVVALPAEWKLSPKEAEVFRALLKRDVVRFSAINAALYSDRPDPPDDRSIYVFVWRARRKLKTFGIVISRVRGIGYSLDGGTRERFKERIAA